VLANNQWSRDPISDGTVASAPGRSHRRPAHATRVAAALCCSAEGMHAASRAMANGRRREGRNERTAATAAMTQRRSFRPVQQPRGGYRIEHGHRAGESIFTIIAPSGARLYSFSDLGSAETEAATLNGS
jgi:hypothetical protein